MRPIGPISSISRIRSKTQHVFRSQCFRVLDTPLLELRQLLELLVS